MSEKKLVIPPPRQDRQPLRTNLLNAMQKGATALTPLFPYMHRGAIVPATSVMYGGAERSHGHFFHKNTVDEIIVAFVAEGATLKTGQLYVGGRSHGVNSFLKDEKQEGSYAVFSVCQRQVEEGTQTEHITLHCSHCRALVFDHAFDAAPNDDGHELRHPFPSIRGSHDAIEAFNNDVEARTCDACGHVQDRFPIETWGFTRYVNQSELGVRAHRDLLQTAAEALGEASR